MNKLIINAIGIVLLIPVSIYAQHNFNISENSGLTIAVSNEIPKYEGDIVDYEKILTIEYDDTNINSYIDRPFPFHINAEGNYNVPDPFNKRIVIYDKEGKYIGEYGQSGEGPGEFQFIELITYDNQYAYYYDRNLGRTTIYNNNRDMIDIIRPLYGSPYGLEAIFPVIDDNTMIAFQRMRSLVDNNLIFSKMRAYIMNADGDTLNIIETEECPEQYRVPASPGFSAMVKNIPIGARSLFAVNPDGMFVLGSGINNNYYVYRKNGVAVMNVKINIPTQTVTTEERNMIRDHMEEEVMRMPAPLRAQKRRENESCIIPEIKGYWDSAVFDDNNYIWLRVPELAEIRRTEGGALYILIAPNGEFFGRTRWPVIDGRIQGNYLLGIERNNQTEELNPVVYKIKWKFDNH